MKADLGEGNRIMRGSNKYEVRDLNDKENDFL